MSSAAESITIFLDERLPDLSPGERARFEKYRVPPRSMKLDRGLEDHGPIQVWVVAAVGPEVLMVEHPSRVMHVGSLAGRGPATLAELRSQQLEDVVRAFPPSTLAERTGPNGSPVEPWTIASFVATGAQHPWPPFRHDPDPIRSQTIEVATAACSVCREARGYLVIGHEYRDGGFDAAYPWCIGSGLAHAQFGSVGRLDVDPRPGTAPAANAHAEIQQRTPRYIAWQESLWFTCCDDGMAFLGRPHGARLRDAPEAVLEAARRADILVSYSEAEREEFLADVPPDGPLSLYLFQCHHCAAYHVHSDAC